MLGTFASLPFLAGKTFNKGKVIDFLIFCDNICRGWLKKMRQKIYLETSVVSYFVSRKAIPDQSPEDALHISIAAVNGIDVVVTWNFKHLNNPFTRTKIRKAIEQDGYTCPEICSPDEFLGDEI